MDGLLFLFIESRLRQDLWVRFLLALISAALFDLGEASCRATSLSRVNAPSVFGFTGEVEFPDRRAVCDV